MEMNSKYIINTGTITYALRGRDALRRGGISAYMQRSRDNSAIGCGYSIIAAGSLAKIKAILAGEGIKYVSVIGGEEI